MTTFMKFLLYALLVVPNLSWSMDFQQITEPLQTIANSPWGRWGKNVANAAAIKTCNAAFSIATESLLGTGRLCRNNLTDERYLSLSLMGCHTIQRRTGNNVTTQAVAIFQKNAQRKREALLSANASNVEIVADQGCRVNVPLPPQGFFATILQLARVTDEL